MINLTFWFLVLNPFEWRLRWQSDIIIVGIGVIIAIAASIIATVSASRWWGIAIAASLGMGVLFELALE